MFPASTAAKLSPPVTATGLVRFVVVPSPSWPLSLSPQQYAAPAVVTPQVWKLPALTAAKVSPPTTATGLVCFVFAQVPSPSAPPPLYPQQYAAPAVVMAHVW